MNSKTDNINNNLIFHLEKAIENQEFDIYYQPIIHTISGSLCGFEALARWCHPEYGFLNPASFIETLEDTRQIYHLDVYVVEEVCKRYEAEVEAGHSVVPFSVNLSCHDFEAMDIFGVIQHLTKKYRVPKNMLNIEITERAFAENVASVATTINNFRDAGYQVWMDDFGSGYSSLNTLKEYELDELKIDMGFLSDMSDKSRHIIASIISMAKNLRMVTLMEGVETEEQVAFLKQAGCDRMQGFYFSKPLPYNEIIRVLEKKKICFETEEDRRYYHEINRINLLSPSPFQYESDRLERHGGGIPLALLEVDKDNFKYIYENQEFRDNLKVVGASNARETIQKLTHFGILSHKEIAEFIQKIVTVKEEKIVFSINGDICSAKGKLVSNNGDRHAILLSITNITKAMDINHEKMMDQKLKNLYSVYQRVSVMRPLKDEIITVFCKVNEFIPCDEICSLSEVISRYSDLMVLPEDRKKYLDFIDIETIEERIRNSSSGFINTKIRTLDDDGNYSKKMYLAVPMGNNEVMLLVRHANL